MKNVREQTATFEFYKNILRIFCMIKLMRPSKNLHWSKPAKKNLVQPCKDQFHTNLMKPNPKIKSIFTPKIKFLLYRMPDFTKNRRFYMK